MLIGFTGSREGMTDLQKQKFETFLKDNLSSIKGFIHGDCAGADTQAHVIAKELGIFIKIFPPDNATLRAFNKAEFMAPESPYLTRNRHIVNNCTMLVAIPKEKTEAIRSGTWSTVRYAVKEDRPVLIIFPDGTTCELNPHT